MSLIDKKKDAMGDVLIKVKVLLINIIISLALYILIFIIGSITMFACNVSQAKMFDVKCNNTGVLINDELIIEKIPINIINDSSIINKYINNNTSNNENASQITQIFQILESHKKNEDKLKFCVNQEENKYFGIFKNSIKHTVNFIYDIIIWYSNFLNNNISEIFILWLSPFFSFLFFMFLLFIAGFYLSYRLILNSCINIFNNVFTRFFEINIFSRILQIMISFLWILLTLFGIAITPIITYGLVLYSIFNILTQKFKKEANNSTRYNYGIFQKMVDNLIYKKNYNMILMLFLCVLNVFLFDFLAGFIIFALILIFYYVFNNKFNLSEISLSNFTDKITS